MSTQKSVDRNLLSRVRRASPVLPLLCALTLSACGTNGAASLDTASTPSSQATSAAPHSTAPSTPADEQKPSATTPQTTSPSPSQPTQTADSPTPTPANTAPNSSTLIKTPMSLPSTCPATGQASLSFGGFARIEEPSATYTVNGTPTIAVVLTCNGGGSAAFPSLAFYDEELNLIASYDLSKISDAESYEPTVTSLEPQGDTLHVEWSNERLPTDTRGIHSGSGTGSADLSWNGSSFDKSNTTVHDAQGNPVSS